MATLLVKNWLNTILTHYTQKGRIPLAPLSQTEAPVEAGFAFSALLRTEARASGPISQYSWRRTTDEVLYIQLFGREQASIQGDCFGAGEIHSKN